MFTRNVPFLRAKEPEVVKKVERYRLEIVGLASPYSVEPRALKGDLILLLPPNKRQQAVVH